MEIELKRRCPDPFVSRDQEDNMEKQWAEAWKQACKAYKSGSDTDDFLDRMAELIGIYGDPNVSPPQGTIFANQNTEVAKAARGGFNS